MRVESHPDIAGVWRVSAAPAGEWPRPWVGVLGGLHGDEPCGVQALGWLRSGELPLRAGTLVLIHGNLDAEGTRHTEGGVDLNRVFDLAFRDRLPEAEWAPEHHRALALAPLLDELDAAIDLHSASAPTEPFAIAMQGGVEVARQLGLRFVTHGWEVVSDIGAGVAVARVSGRGRPAMGVECGSHADASALQTAQRVVRGFLGALGLLDEQAGGEAPSVLEVFASVPRPHAEFRFARPLRGFSALDEGELIGPDVRAPRRCIALLPNDDVEPGKPCVYLAVESG